MPARSFNGERGATVLIFTLLLSFALIPILGLCVDVSFVYLANSRIHAAVDAAALAGGRSLSAGLDFTSQQTSAQNVALQYFAANYPANFLGSQKVNVTALAQQSGDLYRTVTVTASAEVPLSFMRMVGYKTATVNASAQTSRRDINIVLVLDRSYSMRYVCGTMVSVARNFIEGFTNGSDKVGLVTFVGTAKEDFAPNTNFKGPGNLVDDPGGNDIFKNLACPGSTGSSEALHVALQSSTTAARPGALNVIVFFTDGYPTSFTAQLHKTPASTCTTSGFFPATLADVGLLQPVSRGINQGNPPQLTIAGCTLASWADFQNNFTGIPVTDGDSSTPDADLYLNMTDHYSPLTRNANGLIDITYQNVLTVSKSTAWDAARKIRAAGITLYTIGLDGNGGLDNQLLKEMANDRSSSTFDATQPVGRYAYASDAGQLAAAFNSIKSELLRLAQ